MSFDLSDYSYYVATGALAGSVGTIISQPFDTCKIHLQNKKPLGIFERTIMQNIRWGYRGMKPSIIGYTVEKSLVFGTYLTACKLFQLDEQNMYHTFGAGLLSGLIASLSIAPAEQIKIDNQLGTRKNYSLRYFYKEIPYLYKGLPYTSAREGIGFGIYFNVYNQLSKYYNSNKNDSFWLKMAKTAGIGSMSAFIAWIPIYPIDILKSRIQANGSRGKGIVYDMKEMLINDLRSTSGFKNKLKILYGGYHYAAMRFIPFHASCFVIYDLSKQYRENMKYQTLKKFALHINDMI